MAVVAMPAAFKIRRATWGLRANTTAFSSPLNRGTQTQELPGAQWIATIEAPPMPRADAASCFAWLANLGGQAGRFYLSPPACEAPLGTAAGEPGAVSGAGQTGRALATIGWAAGATFRAGDYLSFPTSAGVELKIVTADGVANASGGLLISIAPPIRTPPANGAVVTVTGARGIFRLVDDEQAKWAIEEAVMFGLAFDAVESFFGV